MHMTRTCRHCGAEINGEAPFGHCPGCLIKLGFGPIPEAATAEVSKPGKTRLFGDYELIEQIGRGGMGVVYKARQAALNRPVALKMILAGELASPASVERFQIEAEAAANLHHPNIVPIFEIGEHGGSHYFSMKLVEGESLDKMMAEFALPKPSDSPCSKAILRQAHSQIARLMATVARAADYAHRHGILHRDLKPSNILIDAEGTPFLTDFGLAKIASRGDSVTESGDIIGSLSYMAPEQAQGNKVSAAADIYSLSLRTAHE
jgi:serine/threonine-protein kinase